ncbi:hypothetical protein GUITHDRAFT_111379 [Guillardia theta CCMP2712]|uniref:Pre-mRNA-splicing factor SPF27 n=1 Tax=Guillardia theta (strain CCMP2712) TaxID=905079 RepID=L1J322_GUITC|nr:hypothetical protein GUITHDRAFT_111379 [Guillardia theta CCMP2712]EKX42707.1 hypothetical protein GUITHDRAFT_111379 [Guillardia theta CCMP2712]|eukprot:XP_005829687.1 hypothetical protein GUITHDRAFT_111379 [Guillardia theta CCMP2712]
MKMALVAAGGNDGQLITRPGEAPLPNCLARLIQNKHQIVVDALPYIDKEYDNPHYRQVVDRMVEEEMESFAPEDYISSLPPIPALSLPEGSALRAEYDRMMQDEEYKFAEFDMSRYECHAPQGKDAADPEKWKEAVRTAQAHHELTTARGYNSEMLAQHGSNAWRAYNSGLEDLNQVYKFENDQMKAKVKPPPVGCPSDKQLEVVEINRKRMADQLMMENKIRRLSERYQLAVTKNMRIEAECIRFARKSWGSRTKRLQANRPKLEGTQELKGNAKE